MESAHPSSGENVANRETGEHLEGQTAGGERSHTSTRVGTRNGHGETGERSHRQLRAVPTNNLQPRTESRPGRTTVALARADERQRLARDLHDGVQSELVSLMLRLKLAEQDRTIPTALAATFVALEDHAAAALASLREIADGIYPLPLVKLGLAEALRAQAARAPIKVSIAGTAPRSTDEAEATVYLCCSEVIQNVAKHAGPFAQAKLGLHHCHGVLAVGIEDDGRGFDPAQIPDNMGLRNIRERVQTLDGTVRLTSTPGHGTVLTLSLPWPPRQPTTNPPSRGRPHKAGSGPACSC